MLDDAFARLQMAASVAATSPHNSRPEPTERQAIAGNYKKAPFRFAPGLLLMMENVRNSVRTGTSEDGKTWANRLDAHYGEIAGTVGNDGDPIDVFVGLFPESTAVWVVNQGWPDGGFDEHKVMLGFATEQQARDAYMGSYDRGWTGLQSMAACTLTQLMWWLKFGDKSRQFSADQLPFDGSPAMNKTLWTPDAEPVGVPMHKLMYDLRTQDREGLLLDAVSMADIYADPDIQSLPMLDALVVEVARMTQKMNLLQRVMESAAGTIQPTGYTISDPIKARGVMQVAVLFAMSDGQTITVWFHNPDTTPTKLMPLDELISWKWMLNKKDITIVVAPEQGRELNVREVARRIMRLVERNAPTFAKANEKLSARIAEEKAIDTEIVELTGQLASLDTKIEVAKQRKADDYSRSVRDFMARMDAIQKQIEITKPNALPDAPRSLALLEELFAQYDDVADQLRALRGEAPQGRTHWAQWSAIRAAEAARNAPPVEAAPAAEPAGAFRYGLINRPLDAFTAPKGFTGSEPAPAEHSDYARHGIVVYDRRLTPEEVKAFELAVIIDGDEARNGVAASFVASLGEYAPRYAKMSRENAGRDVADMLHSNFKKWAVEQYGGPVSAGSWAEMAGRILGALESTYPAEAPAAAAPASPAYVAFHVDSFNKYTVIVKNDPSYTGFDAVNDAREATKSEFGGGATQVKPTPIPLAEVPADAWQGKGGDWAWFVKGYIGEAAPAAPAPEETPAATQPAADEGQNRSMMPEQVKTAIRFQVTKLQDIAKSFDGVIAARGRGWILALEVKDRAEDIAKAQAKLADIRALAEQHGVMNEYEAVVAEAGGIPDFASYGEPAAATAPESGAWVSPLVSPEGLQALAESRGITVASVSTIPYAAGEGVSRASLTIKGVEAMLRWAPTDASNNGGTYKVEAMDGAFSSEGAVLSDVLDQFSKSADELAAAPAEPAAPSSAAFDDQIDRARDDAIRWANKEQDQYGADWMRANLPAYLVSKWGISQDRALAAVLEWFPVEAAAPAAAGPQAVKRKDDSGFQVWDVQTDAGVRTLQRLNSTESMGLPGWHDVTDPTSKLSYLADTKDDAVAEVIKRYAKPVEAEAPAAVEEPAGPAPATRQEAAAALGLLRQFVGRSQLRAIDQGARGEEKQFFFDKIVEMAGVIDTMPATYGQDGKGDKAVAYLHYFNGGSDWYITEKDMEREQQQAFGMVSLNGDTPEIGYVSIEELIANNVELDLYWKPKTLAAIKGVAEEPDATETPEPEPTVTPAADVHENYIKIAADSIAELRKVDVERVLSSVAADNIDGVTRASLAAWITAQRPDLAAEVADVMAELFPTAEPAAADPAPVEAPAAEAAPAGDPADVAFLQGLINGTEDYFADDLYERLEPLYAKYENDPAMLAMFNQAATIYGDAVVAAAQKALAS